MTLEQLESMFAYTALAFACLWALCRFWGDWEYGRWVIVAYTVTSALGFAANWVLADTWNVVWCSLAVAFGIWSYRRDYG